MRAGFIIAISIIIAITILFEFILYRRWARRIHSNRYRSLFRYSYWGMAALTQIPLWVMLFGGRPEFVIDGAYRYGYYVFQAWQYPLLIYFLPYMTMVGLGWLIKKIMVSYDKKKLKAVQNRQAESATAKPGDNEEGAISRRGFLRSSLSLGALTIDSIPFIASTSAFFQMAAGNNHVVTQKVTVPIKGLPVQFDKFTIAQISDIHVGNLINKKQLKKAADVLTSLNVDMLTVTGDIIDNNNYFLPVAAEFFGSMQKSFKYGSYGVLGNHDLIDDSEELTGYFNDNGLSMLRNRVIEIKKGKAAIQLAGLDYPMPYTRSRNARETGTQNLYRQIEKDFDPKMKKVLLNHHPEDFHFFRTQPIDLTLAGHTHGGQVRFSEERDSLLSPVRSVYKYYVGHYFENNSHLYVNQGLGHWFALRVNTPREITVIQLQAV